jgi:hypothetical protein
VHYLEANLYHSSDWKSEDPATRGNHLDLNRHRLLHGMATQGTRLNTLRCFLMLDIVEALFSALRKAVEDDDRD